MLRFWTSALEVGGIAAVGNFVLWWIFKDWLRLRVFAKITAEQTYDLLRLIVLLVFVFALVTVLKH